MHPGEEISKSLNVFVSMKSYEALMGDEMKKKKDYLEEVVKYSEKYECIAIYGAGKVGVGLYKDLKARGIDVKYFIVTSNVGQLANMSEIAGEDVPIMQIDEAPDLEKTGIIIGVSLGKVSGVIKKLEEYGISEYVTLQQEYVDTILEEFNIPKMEITTIIGCAVNCRYCPQRLLTSNYWMADKEREKRMSFDTFKICIDKLPEVTQIFFAGMSEPFLNEDCIYMIQYAVEKGHRVGVYTTCVGLNLEDCKELVKMPVESVILHVPDEERFAHIDCTEEYWKVVELMLEAVKENGQPFVDSGSCQGTPLKEFMELNHGRIRVETYLHDRAGNLSSDQEEVLESCGYIGGEIYCYHSGARLDHNILLPDGSVVLCCMDYGIKHEIGNLMKSTYEEVMEGRELNNIREALKDDTKELLCRRCTYAVKVKNSSSE